MAGEKIALGFGGNVDYEIEWNSAVFEDLVVQHRIREDEISTGVEVRDMRSLLLSILGYMRAGSGAEVFARDNTIIEEFSKLFKYQVTIGGTGARAAISMAKLGYSARLHVLGDNEHLRRLLPREGTKIWGTEGDSLYPHLVIQYVKGTEINTPALHLTAEAANRIIYVNNPQKLAPQINYAFFDNLEGIEAMLISGFNSIHDRDIMTAFTEKLSQALAGLPPQIRVYWEDACYHVQEFTAIAQKALCPYVEIVGLNEDEFGRYMGIKIDLLDPAQVWSLLPKLKEIIPVPVIVVHTKYWALAYGKDAEKYRSCLKGGINLATTRFRYGDEMNLERYRETSALGKDPQGTEFCGTIQALGGNGICCEPSLDAKETRVTTIGLGDAFVGGFIPAMTSR
ncbi:MAG: ADP-dependent glucokinase/phosphofructokinase [Treponema sp.]|nr:ADP-dependent glucokinase/phosphofructokinase [Treponema sp.]